MLGALEGFSDGEFVVGRLVGTKVGASVITPVGVLLGKLVSSSMGDETTFCSTLITETLPPIGVGGDSPLDTVTAIAIIQETTNSPDTAIIVLNLAIGFVLMS